jgi:hypothetical protein
LKINLAYFFGKYKNLLLYLIITIIIVDACYFLNFDKIRDRDIKLLVTHYNWIEGNSDGIYSSIKNKLEDQGFNIVHDKSKICNTTLNVNFRAEMGPEYIASTRLLGHSGRSEVAYGTNINCSLKLEDNKVKLFEKEILSASSSYSHTGLPSLPFTDGPSPNQTLYQGSLNNFKYNSDFKNIGELIMNAYDNNFPPKEGPSYNLLVATMKGSLYIITGAIRDLKSVVDFIGDHWLQ